MALSPPSLMLKIIWTVHFVLSSWGLLSLLFIVNTYWYTHVAVLAFGFWAIVSNESTDAVLMFIVTLLFSILNDIILLGLYEPRGHDNYEKPGVPTSSRNEYRFALGMAITNLIIKPFSAFLLYRIYQSRAQGTDFDTGIPGLRGAPGFGQGRGPYDNIDSPPPGQYPKQSEPPQYQPPTSYHEAPPTAPSDRQ